LAWRERSKRTSRRLELASAFRNGDALSMPRFAEKSQPLMCIKLKTG
jgi:hypothetical protein